MDYPTFVRLRSGLWDELEAQLAEAAELGDKLTHAELERMALRYRQVLHDHALAAARFPGTGAARRLSRLAIEGTRRLSREEGGRGISPWRFFVHVFPAAFRRQAPTVGLAVALFLTFTLLGFTLTVMVPGFSTFFLRPDAIEGLAEGRLWTEDLTSTAPPSVTSSQIASNNLSVALMAWAGGAVAGFFSLWVLLINGLMLGSVIAVTMHYGMAPPLFEFIAAHGPLELTIIVVSAAGGLVLARGVVAADDRPRAEVLREAAREALVLLGGCLPWLVVLAVVESLVSPAPEVPVAVKAALGLALEAVFLLVATNPLAREEKR